MGLTGPSQSDVQSVKSGLEKNLGKQSILIKPEIDRASLASFKRELATQIGAVSVPVTIKMVSSSAATVSQSVSKQVGNSRELKDLERNLSAIEKEFQKIERSKAAHSIHTMSESLEQFADRSGIALKRFLAFTVATTGVIKLASEIRQAFGDAIKFEENLVKVSQVSERNLKQLNSLRSSILDVSRAVGTSAVDLSDATLTIAQAGLPLNKVKEAMEAIAKANVSPTFGSSKESAEALIATISQFKSEATNLEAILSKINFISAKEAVESQDLVDAIQRGGGAAALAGTKFNEYLSIITAVRATTRESADQIATGIRTITANIASPATIEFFRKKYKVDIAPGDKVDDLVTAIDKIKTRLGQLGELPTIKDIIDPETGKITQELTNKSVAFSEALEKLGGKRNQSRLIPLFTELSKIKQLTSSFDEVDPLTGLKKSENTFANDVQKSQAALQRSIDSTKTAFLQLGDEILKNEGTRGLIELFLGVSRAIADTTKEVVKLSTVLAPIFAPIVARGIGTFARAFSPSRLFGAPSQFRAHGGEIFGNTPGDSVPCMLTPGEVVLNKSQQQSLGRIMGTDPKNVFGKIGVPGFAGGGEVEEKSNKKTVRDDKIFRTYSKFITRYFPQMEYFGDVSKDSLSFEAFKKSANSKKNKPKGLDSLLDRFVANYDDITRKKANFGKENVRNVESIDSLSTTYQNYNLRRSKELYNAIGKMTILADMSGTNIPMPGITLDTGVVGQASDMIIRFNPEIIGKHKDRIDATIKHELAHFADFNAVPRGARYDSNKNLLGSTQAGGKYAEVVEKLKPFTNLVAGKVPGNLKFMNGQNAREYISKPEEILAFASQNLNDDDYVNFIKDPNNFKLSKLRKSYRQSINRYFKGTVPGFSSGGEVSSNISKAIFGKSVAEQTRKYIDDGKLYVFDNSYGVYHKVNKDFSISEDFYDTLPRGAKSISIQPYSSQYETGQRKGANLLPITDPKLTKLDEIGLSTIAPSSSVDPIIDRLSAIGGLTPLSLLREINKRRPGFNQLVKTSFGESNVQGQGVFGRRGKTGITIEDAAEIISRYKSGYGSGFFSQDKLPGPNIGELRVHIAVDDSGKVRLVKSGTQQKYTGLQQAIQSIGFNKGEAKETLTGFSKAAKVTAFKTIQELVSKKDIKGAFFGVDVGSTSYAAAQKSGINTQKFRGLNRDLGTVVYELNPSEESGSSGYLGGQGIGRFVQDVIGVKNDKNPASDKIVKDRIIQIILGKGPSSVQTIDDSEKIAAEKSYASMLDYITNANKQEEYGPKIGKFRRLFSAAKSKISDAFTANPFDKNGMTAFQAKLNEELEYTDVFGNDKVRGQTSIERFADPKKKYGIGVGKFAHGGTVPGSGHGDTVPALLSPGEVVLNKRQQGKLDQLTGSSAALFKAAGVPGFNTGGVIGKVATGIALGGSFLPSIEGFGGVKDILEAVAPIIGTVTASFIGLRSAFENVKGMNDWKDGLEESNKALAYSAKNLDQFKKEIDLSSKEFQSASKKYDAKNFKELIEFQENKVETLKSKPAFYWTSKGKDAEKEIAAAELGLQRIKNKEMELLSVKNSAARRMNTAILDPRIKENEKIIRQENEKIALNSKQIAQAEKNAKIAAAASAVGLGASIFLVGRGTKQISQSENFNKESEASGRFNLAAGSAIGGGIAGAGTGFQFGGPKGAAVGAIAGTVSGAYQGISDANNLVKEKYSASLNDFIQSNTKNDKRADANQISLFNRLINSKYKLDSNSKFSEGSTLFSMSGIEEGTSARSSLLDYAYSPGAIFSPKQMVNRISGEFGFDTTNKGKINTKTYEEALYKFEQANNPLSMTNIANRFGYGNSITENPFAALTEKVADKNGNVSIAAPGSAGGKYYKNAELAQDTRTFLDDKAKLYSKFEEFEKDYSESLSRLSVATNLERDMVNLIYKGIIEDKESTTNKQKAAIKAFDDQANDIEKFNASLSHSLEKIKRSSIGVLLGEGIRVQAPSLRKPDFTSAAQTQDFNRDVRSVTGGFGDFGNKIGLDFTNLLSEQQRFEGVLSDIRSGKKENGLTAQPKDLIDQFFKTSNLKETDKSVLSANADKYISSDNFNRDNIRAATDAQQIFSDSAENYKKVLNPMTEATIEATNRLLDFGSKVSELRDKAEDLRKPFDSISQILDIRGQSRELTADQVMVAQRQSESARTIGETGGLTAAQLRSNILGGDQRLQGLQKKLDVAQNAQERTLLAQQITAEEAARTKATKGLEFLANSTQELSVVQQQLQKAESDRMNKRSLFETLAFGSSDDRFSARRNIQRLNSGQTLGTEGTREVVNFLRQFGETSLKELGINRQGTASQEAERISADFIRKQQGQFGLNVAGRDLGQEILQSPEQKKLGREAEGLVKRQQDAKNEQANVLDTRAREVAQQAFKEFNDVFKNFKAENLVVNAEKVVLNGAADIKGAIALEGNVNVAVNINAPGFEQMGEELKKNVMGQVNAQVIKILKNNGIPVDRPVV